MKKSFLFFIVTICLVPLSVAHSAVAVKKAVPVATSNSSGTEGAASLVPSLIGLVSGVIEMNAKQNALSADCIPSSAEISFVDNTMKEWAKTGQVTADEMSRSLGRDRCNIGADCFAIEVQTSYNTAGLKLHHNYFAGPGNENMIWENFPKVGKGVYCKNGLISGCTGNDAVTVSDAYDLFNWIDFGPADYTPSEATMAARLLNKVETCSASKLNAKKKALWGEFLVNTAGSLGQKTNTGSIMEQVSGIATGGGAGALGSIGSIATQFIAK